MAAIASVFVFVAAGHLGDPAIASMRTAIEQTLGASARITIDVTDEIPSDDDAVLLSDMLAVTAVAEVSWREPKVDAATVRVFARTHATWVDRLVRFQPADEDFERGRTIGYALSAFVPEPTEPPPEPAPAEPPPPPVHRDVAPPPPPPPSLSPSLSLDLAASMARVSGVDLLGGGIVAAWVRRGIGARAQLGVRAGRLDAVDASLVDLRVAVGPAYTWSFDRITTGVALDAVLLRETIAHGGERRSQLLPAGAISFQLSWDAFGPVWLGASLGAEVVAGTTRVVVGSEPASSLSPVRTLATLTIGVRW